MLEERPPHTEGNSNNRDIHTQVDSILAEIFLRPEFRHWAAGQTSNAPYDELGSDLAEIIETISEADRALQQEVAGWTQEQIDGKYYQLLADNLGLTELLQEKMDYLQRHRKKVAVGFFFKDSAAIQKTVIEPMAAQLQVQYFALFSPNLAGIPVTASKADYAQFFKNYSDYLAYYRQLHGLADRLVFRCESPTCQHWLLKGIRHCDYCGVRIHNPGRLPER